MADGNIIFRDFLSSLFDHLEVLSGYFFGIFNEHFQRFGSASRIHLTNDLSDKSL